MTNAAEQMHARVVAKGTVLFEQGEAGAEMYVIQGGKVSVSRTIRDREIVLAVLGQGEMLGEMALVNNAPRSATARVVEDAKLLVVGADQFDEMIRNNIEVAVRLIKKLATRLDDAGQQIELLMHRDPSSRVAHCLLRQAAVAGEPREGGTAVLISDPELEERLGLSKEEVARVLARLEKSGLVTRAGDREFVVKDAAAFEEFLKFAGVADQVLGAI